jgi:CTP synthase (UTP-ammonia lyase)
MTNTDNTTITMMRIPMISAADEAEATPTMTSIATVASAGITKTYIIYNRSLCLPRNFESMHNK